MVDIKEEAIELREKLEKEFEQVVVTGETIETVKMRPAGRSSSFLGIRSTAGGYEACVVDIIIDEDGNEKMRVGL